MTRVVDGAEGLRALVGTRLGVGDWLLVDQERIDGFARVTGDAAAPATASVRRDRSRASG